MKWTGSFTLGVHVLELSALVISEKRTLAYSSSYYSRTSVTRTSLGPWECVRDMGSSSHCGLIVAPGQEENGDNLGKSF